MKKPLEISTRLWSILPITIIFAAVVFRLSWNIPNTVPPVQVAWWLAIITAVVGYYLIIRFVSRPIPMERLMAPWGRAVIIIVVMVALVIATVYLYQHIPSSVAVISRVVLGLAVALNISGYFFLVVLVRPGLMARLKTGTVRIAVSAFMTAALVCLTIHTIRFLPSPEAVQIQSKVMAVLLLAALASGHPLLLKYTWCVWRRVKR